MTSDPDQARPDCSAQAPRLLSPDRLRQVETVYRELTMERYHLEFSLGHRLVYLRPYASPRVARLLVRTGNIAHAPLKRATDTGLFVYELIHHGYDTAGGAHIVQRMRDLHGRWNIRNEDFLWMLGAFVVLSPRLIDQVCRRPLDDGERQVVVDWWRELGTRMGINDIPTDFASFAAAFDEYELTHLRRSPAGQQLLAATWQAALATMPPVLRPFTGAAIAALTGEPARTALGLDNPGPLITKAVHLALRTHSHTGALAAAAPTFVSGGPQLAYPHGYTLDDLGPSDEGR